LAPHPPGHFLSPFFLPPSAVALRFARGSLLPYPHSSFLFVEVGAFSNLKKLFLFFLFSPPQNLPPSLQTTFFLGGLSPPWTKQKPGGRPPPKHKPPPPHGKQKPPCWIFPPGGFLFGVQQIGAHNPPGRGKSHLPPFFVQLSFSLHERLYKIIGGVFFTTCVTPSSTAPPRQGKRVIFPPWGFPFRGNPNHNTTFISPGR